MIKLQPRVGLMLLSMLFLVTPALAQEREGAAAPANAAMQTSDRPTVPTDASAWAGAMLIIVAAMFLMAAVIGPAVRAEMVEQAPSHDDHGHDDHGEHDDHAHGHGH